MSSIMGATITWSQEQLKRWHLLKMEQEKSITLKEAVRRMGVSYRQSKRLKRAAARDGPRGMVHGNRGQAPANVLKESLRQRIVELSIARYVTFNDSHFTEKLIAREGIRVNRETVRKIQRSAGIASKRRRRPPDTAGDGIEGLRKA
jgi:transposase